MTQFREGQEVEVATVSTVCWHRARILYLVTPGHVKNECGLDVYKVAFGDGPIGYFDTAHIRPPRHVASLTRQA